MAYHYLDPARANDPHALPSIETFLAAEGELVDEDGVPMPSGWYWQSCLPGCLPDGEPRGPFPSEAEALDDARDGMDD